MKAKGGRFDQIKISVLIMVCITVLYWLQDIYRPYLPLPFFYKAIGIYKILLLILYLFFWPMLFVVLFKSDRKSIILAILILVIPISCGITAKWALMRRYYYKAAELNGYRFHLVTELEWGESLYYYQIYKCNKIDLKCEIVAEFESFVSSSSDISFISDPESKEINVVENLSHKNEFLIYTYGQNQSRMGHGCDELNGFLYCLSTLDDYLYNHYPSTYEFHKCKKDFSSCKRLPFEYIPKIDREIYSFVNEELQRIEIYTFPYYDTTQKIDPRIIIYSYGSEPICYVEGCTLKNH